MKQDKAGGVLRTESRGELKKIYRRGFSKRRLNFEFQRNCGTGKNFLEKVWPWKMCKKHFQDK